MKGFAQHSGSLRIGSASVYRKPAGKTTFKGKVKKRKTTKRNITITLFCDKLKARRITRENKAGKIFYKNDSRQPRFVETFPEYAGKKIKVRTSAHKILDTFPPKAEAWLKENFHI